MRPISCVVALTFGQLTSHVFSFIIIELRHDVIVNIIVVVVIVRNEYYYSAVSQKKLQEHLTVKNMSVSHSQILQ